MKRLKKILSLGAVTMCAATPALAAAPARVAETAVFPLHFEMNRGQADAAVRFLARGPGCQFFVMPDEAVLQLGRFDASAGGSRLSRVLENRPATFRSRDVRLKFLNTNPAARVTGSGELPGTLNYLIGNDPSKWQTGVSLFTQVRVEGIYRGVDLIYYGNSRRLEYDFIVSPGADPSVIGIRFEGMEKISVNPDGDLVLDLGGEEIIQPRPVVYQNARGVKKKISGDYKLIDRQTVKFEIGAYDRARPLVIDPILSYSTFFGGHSTDTGWAVALDTQGNVYMAGESLSANLPTGTSSHTNAYNGGTLLHGDAFVVKFDNLGTNIIYRTYIGGRLEEAAFGMDVDAAGNVYLTGYTDSTDFPTVNAIYNSISGVPAPTGIHPQDAFVAKLGPYGTNLVYSTYLGGANIDLGIGISLDAGGNAHVAGYALSANFPVRNAIQPFHAGSGDAFVLAIDPSGTNLIYSTYLGGARQDLANDVVADAAGNAYVTGYSGSEDFPVTNAFQNRLNNLTNSSLAYDAFLTKVAPDGSALTWSTYLGGNNNDFGYRVTLDAAENIFVTGSTTSPNFPGISTNLPSSVSRAGVDADAFVVKFAPDGMNRIYTAVFGGGLDDIGWDVAVDPAGNAHVTGTTRSVDFPRANVSGILASGNAGILDVFVTKLNVAGNAFVYSAQLGGATEDSGYGVDTDATGNTYVAGETSSLNFPTYAARQSNMGGIRDAFLAKISEPPNLAIAAGAGEVSLSWASFNPEYVLLSRTNIAVTNNWTPVATPPVVTNGQHVVQLPATNTAVFFRLFRP